jgi:hypothetical protein
MFVDSAVKSPNYFEFLVCKYFFVKIWISYIDFKIKKIALDPASPNFEGKSCPNRLCLGDAR